MVSPETLESEKYNLLRNNCFQVSVAAMSKSNLAFKKIHDTVIPNVGFIKVQLIWIKTRNMGTCYSGGYGAKRVMLLY